LLNGSYGLEGATKVPLETVFRDACRYIKLLKDPKTSREIYEINKQVDIEYGDDIFDYDVSVVWPLLDSGVPLDEQGGIVDKFTISNKSTEMSKVLIAHELIHALKDTNGNEIKNRFLTGEVLPILFEMIIAHNETPKLARKVLLYRLNSLAEDVAYYYYAKNYCTSEKDLQSYVDSVAVEYLNAFYYSLILYNLYQQDEDALLKEMNTVLLHQKTTRDMIQGLGLYNESSNDRIVIKELTRIHKLL
jgi:hypothetical protein